MPNTIAPKFSSGIGAIDGVWGGLYEGGTYLVHGTVASGRTVVPLLFTQRGCDSGDRCLFISPDRPKDLVIQASAIGFDVRAAHHAGTLKLVRIPALLGYKDVDDDILAEALAELTRTIKKNRASRVVINQFLPFAQFRSLDRFRTELITMLDALESTKSTVMIVLPEPDTPVAAKVLSFLRERCVAAISTEKLDRTDGSAEYFLHLNPQFGHLTKQARIDWALAESLEAATPLYNEGLDIFADETVDIDAPSMQTPVSSDSPESHVPPVTGDDVENWSMDDFIKRMPLDAAEVPTPSIEPVPTDWEKAVENIEDTTFSAQQHQPDPIFENSLDLGNADFSSADEGILDELFFDFEKKGEAFSEVRTNVYSQREAFEATLQSYFAKKTYSNTPFLLVAMRMDRRNENQALDFDFVADVVSATISADDALFIHDDRERLVVVLANTEPDGAQSFFSRIRKELRNESPHLAETLLQTVSAIVVQGGHPFDNAKEFLSYVLDNN